MKIHQDWLGTTPLKAAVMNLTAVVAAMPRKITPHPRVLPLHRVVQSTSTLSIPKRERRRIGYPDRIFIAAPSTARVIAGSLPGFNTQKSAPKK